LFLDHLLRKVDDGASVAKLQRLQRLGRNRGCRCQFWFHAHELTPRSPSNNGPNGPVRISYRTARIMPRHSFITDAGPEVALSELCVVQIGDEASKIEIRTRFGWRHSQYRALTPQKKPMKKILVIEDEPEMRRNLTTVLRLEQFQPLAAENGRVGVDVAKKEKPDLILCDIMMPELDGHGVLQALQADPELSLIPFIFLTAKGEKEDLRNGMNLGADDYLTKPVGKADLLEAIDARLRRAEQQAKREFKADFSSTDPFMKLGLTPRAAEVLLWVAQGKTNSDIGTILGISESTVKKHLLEIFAKLGVETRSAATLRALEVLSAPVGANR